MGTQLNIGRMYNCRLSCLLIVSNFNGSPHSYVVLHVQVLHFQVLHFQRPHSTTIVKRRLQLRFNFRSTASPPLFRLTASVS